MIGLSWVTLRRSGCTDRRSPEENSDRTSKGCRRGAAASTATALAMVDTPVTSASTQQQLAPLRVCATHYKYVERLRNNKEEPGRAERHGSKHSHRAQEPAEGGGKRSAELQRETAAQQEHASRHKEPYDALPVP